MKKISLKKEQELLREQEEFLKQPRHSFDDKHETRKAKMRAWYHNNKEKTKIEKKELENRRRIIELDILESQINSGWIYKEETKREKKELDNAVPYDLELRNKQMVLQIAQEELKRSQVVTSRYLYMSLLFCSTAIILQLISTVGAFFTASINYI